MFVKTQFEKVVNVAQFDTIEIQWYKQESENLYHRIVAVSGQNDTKSEVLAEFSKDESDRTTVENVYDRLWDALLGGKHGFDITYHLS